MGLSAPLFQMRIEPLGASVPLPAKLSLLDAAQAAGIHMRRLCKNGTCRECMARLMDGQVQYRVAWPGLSADEKAEGWVLPCVALAQSDIVLLQPRLTTALGGP